MPTSPEVQELVDKIKKLDRAKFLRVQQLLRVTTRAGEHSAAKMKRTKAKPTA